MPPCPPRRGVPLRALSALVLLLAACAADEGAQPDPVITTPGAFVGSRHPEGGIEIRKILQAFRFENSLALVVTEYAPIAPDYAAARRLARDPALSIRRSSTLIAERDLVEPEILWYRSLAEEERDGTP